MDIQLQRLSQINSKDIIELNTHPKVLEHMPLGDTQFDDEYCRAWVAQKEEHWNQFGYGVWALIIDGQFCGWGGFQNEDGDADLALVLHPNYWGYGKKITKKMIEQGFSELNFSSITIHLPLSRTKLSVFFRSGFYFDAQVNFDQIPFKRFRLDKHKYQILK
ncbi:GNAT family N-acetyltransferase [Providencia sneebia]|uniref:N-acetyltransferase GCN5 n=1 Tax=Providencia sneebia DSM 19967 TaxID=1141660 RepID=K8WD64_9GAMM|nr:GNAT family N-acetyltransferase [Providencia sneebia]EKT58504.1 N-acetyltransferase GCN5 [Providencia sneebia DSM 19967]